MKKIIYILFLVANTFNCFSSKRYEVSGGTGNWNSTTNWSLTSGGASGSAVPTSADSVVFDTNSGSITLNVNAPVLTIDFTTYTNTIAWNNNITVNGAGNSCTLGASMVFSSTVSISVASLTLFNNLTLTSNGKTFPYTLTLDNINVTLADDFHCGRLLTENNPSTITGNHDIYNSGDLVLIGNIMLGTSSTVNIFMTGSSATWSGDLYVYPNLVVTGTLTASGTVRLGVSTLTVLTGSLITTGSTIEIPAGITHINAPTTNFNNITVFSNGGLSIDSTLIINGTLSLSGNRLMGTHGATINNLTVASTGNQFMAANTYVVNGLFTAVGISGTNINLSSTDATIKSILTLNGTQNVRYCSATRIDSSNGVTIHSLGGILTQTINWINSNTNFFMFN